MPCVWSILNRESNSISYQLLGHSLHSDFDRTNYILSSDQVLRSCVIGQLARFTPPRHMGRISWKLFMSKLWLKSEIYSNCYCSNRLALKFFPREMLSMAHPWCFSDSVLSIGFMRLISYIFTFCFDIAW